MSSIGFYIPIPEDLAERLSELPLLHQRATFEQAVHKALDAQGWPSGSLGNGTRMRFDNQSYWYVILFNVDGHLKGHVGPIDEETRARRTASSWRSGGLRATVSRTPVGPALTNAY